MGCAMTTGLAAVFDIAELLNLLCPQDTLVAPDEAIEQLLAHELSQLLDLPFAQDHDLKIRHLAHIRRMEDRLRRHHLDLAHYLSNPFFGQPTGDICLTLELRRTTLIMRTTPHATSSRPTDRHS